MTQCVTGGPRQSVTRHEERVRESAVFKSAKTSFLR